MFSISLCNLHSSGSSPCVSRRHDHHFTLLVCPKHCQSMKVCRLTSASNSTTKLYHLFVSKLAHNTQVYMPYLSHCENSSQAVASHSQPCSCILSTMSSLVPLIKSIIHEWYSSVSFFSHSTWRLRVSSCSLRAERILLVFALLLSCSLANRSSRLSISSAKAHICFSSSMWPVFFCFAIWRDNSKTVSSRIFSALW